MASSDFSIICTGLSQTTSIKGLVLEYSDLTTHQAMELARALGQNRSLEGVEITMTITDDGIRILRQVLSSHPTVKEIRLPYTESDHSSSATPTYTLCGDDDLKL